MHGVQVSSMRKKMETVLGVKTNTNMFSTLLLFFLPWNAHQENIVFERDSEAV